MKEIQMQRKDSSVRKGKVSKTSEKNFKEDIFDTSEWRCKVCGHIEYSYETSEECPYCFYPDNAFKNIAAAGTKPR